MTGATRGQTAADLQTTIGRATGGNIEAQYELGNAYSNGGAGVAQNFAEAFKWYRRAAEKGFAPAQFNVGLAYELGRGVAADEKQAFRYYLLAAEQGFAPAQFNVGNMYSSGRGTGQDFFEANLWFKQAADSGLIEAQFNLGFAYEAGNGVKKDPGQAARWYKQAADRGYARAQYNLGLLYEDGRGVTKDPVAAATLYRAAAERGFAPAQINYGLMLSEGRAGVARDPVQGFVWLNRGAQSGVGTAARDALARTLTAEQIAAITRLQGGVAPVIPPPPPTATEPAASAVPESPASEQPLRNGTDDDLVNQLRDQNRRLASDVESLTAENAAAERQAAISSAKIQGLERELTQLRSAGENPAVASETVRSEEEIALLKARFAGSEEPPQAAVIANLQRDNARLTDEVKRSTLELLSLNAQLRSLRQASTPAPVGGAADGNNNTEQMERLTKEKAELEQWARSLEKTLNEKTALAASLESTLATLRQGQTPTDEKLKTELADATNRISQLSATVTELTTVRSELQEKLRAAEGDSTNASALQGALVTANARVEELQQDLAALRQQLSDGGPGADELKAQLAQASQALEKNGEAVAELTSANETLERELAIAKRGVSELGVMREDLAKLRRESRETAGDQRDLSHARERIAALEKQLADALTVRTRGGDEGGKMRTELTESNQTIEKLNSTIAELTAANEKLEQDLESAGKSVAAALAAQSQAVTASSPDAFRMEFSTLNARIKELETQVEEERSGAAREVATLAGQLQRTRETNKSLTEANRALLSAKENDTAAMRDEVAQLGNRVRELTAANEELRRTGQKQFSDMRSLTVERDSLKSQLTDARQVATVLPGLADEKAALQERLEAVGGQLVQLQREHEELQRTHADLSTQLTASRQAAEKARSDLAVVQTQTAEAEKAAEAHTASVAELTQANTQLEREREDMRRLVESYRGDIARLTQATRAAEQQKLDAERSGQQNIDALSAQMGQLRRDLEAARVNQGRVAEASLAQERERAATIAQLRTENAALVARLNQAQGTLDQIASAARLGTPASTIASGGTVPLRPAPPTTNEVRYHTVAEGDSLSRISMRYYGTTNRWQEIYRANRDMLQGNSALRVGMQLRIP
jgi:chromosome segregation ATPase